MRAKLAKKIRKANKRDWIEYYKAMCEWPFPARLRFAWQLVNYRKKAKK